MAQLYNYHIQTFSEITNPGEDGQTFRLVAEVVQADKIGSPEEKSETIQFTVDISCVDSLKSMWTHDPHLVEEENFQKILYEFARRHLEDKLKSGDISGSSRLDFHSENAPNPCPFDPARIEMDYNKWYTIEISRPIGFGH